MLFPLIQCRLAQSLVMGADSAQKVLLHLYTAAYRSARQQECES